MSKVSFETIAKAVKDMLDALPAEARVSTFDLVIALTVTKGFDKPAVQSVIQAITQTAGEEMSRYFHHEQVIAGKRSKWSGRKISRTIWHRPYPLDLPKAEA